GGTRRADPGTGPAGHGLRRDMSGSAPSLSLCRGCRFRLMLRSADLLPPKRPSTPRSARHLSTTDWGLLPGAPVLTRTGLPPAGLTQLPGRNMAASVPTPAAAPLAGTRLGRPGWHRRRVAPMVEAIRRDVRGGATP